MGTEMIAFIEYDKYLYHREFYVDDSPILPPFDGCSDTYCLTKSEGIYTGSKDYMFFNALAGVRNQTSSKPLYPARGLPPNPSIQLRKAIKDGVFEDCFATSWLTLREILAGLAHQEIDKNNLAFESQLLIDILKMLDHQLGEDRSRLVFSFM